MSVRSTRRGARHGAAAVEMAFVAIVFFLFLFGIIEYARFVFTMDIMDAAARTGARYAVANVRDGTNLKSNTRQKVTTTLAGVVYVPTSSIDVDPWDFSSQAVLAGSPTPGPETAKFGQGIRVRVTAAYQPLLPVFVKNKVTSITQTSIMTCESN